VPSLPLCLAAISKRENARSFEAGMEIHRALRWGRRIAPWMILGPITGLLGWRMDRSIRTKDRVLVVLYGLAIMITSAELVLHGKSTLRRMAAMNA